MTLYACDRCGVIYLTPPLDNLCRIAHGRTPAGDVMGLPYYCGGEVAEIVSPNGAPAQPASEAV